ncbi:MAG: DUF1015 domain-containing protein [Candidatus Hodarchaeales archaeon]|jgi:uncharacterized protein (DUF1015 family)
MVVIRPFKAVRPKNQEIAEKIASFPYDVINSEEAREIAKDNPHSFLHVVKPEIDLDEFFAGEITLYDDKIYAKAKENFEKLQQEGWLIQDNKPCFYIYRQIMEGRNQYGIVGCVTGEDYWDNKIKKHELTRKDKETDRIRHVDTVNANAGPVFLFRSKQSEIDEIVEKVTREPPLYDFTTEDNITHTVWMITDDMLNKDIINGFTEVPHIYVADGHHRTATGAIIAKRRAEANPNHTGEEEYNFFLAVIFPAKQLRILDYNRVVKDLNGLSTEEFLGIISEKFEVKKGHEDRKPPKKGTFGMHLDNEWYLLITKPGTYDPDDPIQSLDISILMNNLLDPVLGIGDPRTDKRIDFIGGIRGMDELERRVNIDMRIAFSLYPISIEELMKVADAGLQMPPKVTWFEPKLRSGLLIHVYDGY